MKGINVKYKLMFLVPFVSMVSSCAGYKGVNAGKSVDSETNNNKQVINKPAVYYKGDTLVLVTPGAYRFYNHTLFSR